MWVQDSYAEQSVVPALFFQDDWKVTRNLTLSLGLRYERPGPVTERYNRSIRDFAFNAASPVQAAAQANYARNPIPEIPASAFRTMGGVNFAGVGGQPRELWKKNQNQFMPRIGFAWSMTPKTVIRGGYGVFFDAIGVVNVHVNQAGFSQSTDLVPTLDNGLTYIANIRNPFPGAFTRPRGAAGGLATNLGQDINFFDPNTTSSYMQRWQFAVQRELPGRMLIETSYVGNRGTRMQITRDLNPIPEQYLNKSQTRDQPAINFLSQQVANPFFPNLPRTNLAGTTVARAQFLRPFPQFNNVLSAQSQ